MRSRLSVVLLALLSLLMPNKGHAVHYDPQRDRDVSEIVIFSLTKYPDMPEIHMEPIVIINGAKYTPPPVDAEAAVTKKFSNNYFRTGQRYRIVFGGGDAGNLTVQKEIPAGCVSLISEVAVETTVRLGGQVQALAVSSDNIGRGESSRRASTEDERTAALEVARSLYAQKGVDVALIKKMNTVNLTATDLERDGKFELIGSFEIDGGNYVEYNLFVILEPAAAGKYKAAWTWYHKGGEADLQDRTLVDAVDLDGDGTAEVIAAGHYYESNDYVIYKRQAGKWRPVYKGGGGGC